MSLVDHKVQEFREKKKKGDTRGETQEAELSNAKAVIKASLFLYTPLHHLHTTTRANLTGLMTEWLDD